MGVFAYIKNGVKYKQNQFPGAYPASRVSYNGSDVDTALDELNADLITIEHGTLTPTLSAGFNNVTIAYSKDYVGYYILPSIVLNNAEAGQNQQIRIVGLTERGTNGCKWKIFIDPEYVQYLSSPVFEWTALCQHL